MGRKGNGGIDALRGERPFRKKLMGNLGLERNIDNQAAS
jgi:hypothetical protein